MVKRTETSKIQEIYHQRVSACFGAALIFCLFGCKDVQRIYSYCVVDHVEKQVIYDQSHWVAHCDGDGSVVFPTRVKVGETVYYTPYYQDDDAVTTWATLRKSTSLYHRN